MATKRKWLCVGRAAILVFEAFGCGGPLLASEDRVLLLLGLLPRQAVTLAPVCLARPGLFCRTRLDDCRFEDSMAIKEPSTAAFWIIAITIKAASFSISDVMERITTATPNEN